MPTGTHNNETAAREALMKPKIDIFQAIRHEEIAKALAGKTSCECGCASVYRRVTAEGTQTFSFTGILTSKDYQFQPQTELRCEECDSLIATL